MRLIISLSIPLLLVLYCGDARADSTTRGNELSLVNAIEQALTHYPTVGVAAAEIDRARAVKGEARAAWLPSVSIVAAATRYEEQMPATPIHGFSPGALPTFNDALAQYGFNIGYTLFDGGKRRANIRGAQSRLAAVEASSIQTQQQLMTRVIAAYLSVLSTREKLAAHDVRLEAMRSELSRAEQFYAQDKAAKVEILRVQAALAAAEAGRAQVFSLLVVAEKNLASLIGVDPEQANTTQLKPVTFRDVAAEDDTVLYSVALRTNPRVEQTRYNVAAANAQLAVARGVRWPKLHLTGNWMDQGDFDGNRLDEWNVGVTASFPLFTGGSVKNRIAHSRANRRFAEEKLRLTEIVVQREIDQMLAALNVAQSRVVSLSSAASTYAEVARIEKLLVKTGSGTQTDYLDAESNLVTVRADLAEARHAAIIARVELARLTGQLDLSWITRHLENQP